MTAEEKILGSVPASTLVIALPPSPYCIEGEKSNLYNAAIELHETNGMIEYGNLHSIDDQAQKICFINAQTQHEQRLKYDDVRFILFPAELKYQLREHPLQQKASSISKPGLPQAFNIKFNNGSSLSSDSAISVTSETALHLFKVKQGNVATRMFIPKSTVEMYSIGDQIGTLLKAQHDVSNEQLEEGLQKQEEARTKPIGEYLKAQGVVTDADLRRTLKHQEKLPKVRLGEMLIQEGLITQSHLDKALVMQKEDRGRRLGDILVDIGVTTEDAVHSALARKLGVRLL